MNRLPWAALGALCLAASAAPAGEPARFTRQVLSDVFHAEAAGIGDIDGDGHVDVVYGPHWYAGPEFTARFDMYPPKPFDPQQYSDNFMTAVGDVDGDGRPDVLVNEWPGKAVHWFRNPGGRGGAWAKHLVHPAVDNESPAWLDLTGDGKPELVFHTGGVLGYATPSEPTATERWTFHPCSAREKWGQYQHGLGAADVDGDGRVDLLMNSGWWRQPPVSPAGVTPPEWPKQAVDFGSGGAQMHAYDVDGDGDADVVTSIAAHGYGVSWFEQVREGDAIRFVEHPILPRQAETALAGVQFSQPHAVAVVDVDGDGLRDVVTGKRFWAHGPKGDPDPGGTPLLVWLKLGRSGGAVTWTPHRIDDASGVGTQLAVGDLDRDGRSDVVVGNKKGCVVFRQTAQATDAGRALRLLVCGARTAIVALTPEAPAGAVEWTFPVNSREGWVLPDGNVLLAVSKGARLPGGDVVRGGAAVEIKRGVAGAADTIVWRYDGTQEEVNSIQKTPQGTYVLTEAGPNPRLLEIDAANAVQVEFPLACQKQNPHMQTRMARKQADGTYLVPHLLDFAIIRYGADGAVRGRIDTRVPGEPKINSWPFTAIALPDGGILAGLTNGNRVVEFAPDGAIRWQVTAADTADAISDACGVQRLPGGTTMIASYHIGKGGVRLLEVTPDRTVAWTWTADVPAVHHFHVFEVDGRRVPDPPLR